MQGAPYGNIPSDWRILVTGGAGFIGTHLCRKLCASNLEVHATSRRDRRRAGGEPIWWRADMADPAGARQLFSTVRPDVVVHLAGSVGARADRDLVVPTYHSLATSTVNILVQASELGCRRVILAGSLTEPMPAVEAPAPGSPYAAAKWISSAYGRMFHALYNTPVVILRPFMTYGPAQARDKLIPSVVLSLMQGIPPRLTTGRVRGDWIYIGDVVDAFISAAATPGIDGQTFDVGAGSLISVRTLVDKLLSLMGSSIVPLFGAIPNRPLEQEIVANTRPAMERLGWRATTSLEDGLRETAVWYRAHPHFDPQSTGSS
jgi:nucleoside-diphosphate-sugar epimerase